LYCRLVVVVDGETWTDLPELYIKRDDSAAPRCQISLRAVSNPRLSIVERIEPK
jgi:hypothetical protein